MPVKSYLAFSKKKSLQQLALALKALPGCEVLPAKNKEVCVLVTETKDEEVEKELQKSLLAIESLAHLSLVSGFDENISP